MPRPSRRTAARSKRGGIEADRQAFWQAFPNLACFAPSISKECFGGFVGFQGVASPKNLNDVPPNFFVAPASLQPYSRRLRAVFRRPGPHGFDRVQRSRYFMVRIGCQRVHGGAAIRIERILNLTDIPVSGKKYPSFSRGLSASGNPRSSARRGQRMPGRESRDVIRVFFHFEPRQAWRVER